MKQKRFTPIKILNNRTSKDQILLMQIPETLESSPYTKPQELLQSKNFFLDE
jgi:hypothetical protein